MRQWIDVATLSKARNSKGRFIVKAAVGLPFMLEPGDEVVLVPPKTDVARSVTVLDVHLVDEQTADVQFEDVTDPDVMQQMVGMHCLIRRNLIDESIFADAPGTWEGWKMHDEELGEVGLVTGIVENPMQSLLEVKRDGGGQVLVPVVDEIVHGVDVEGRCVHVRLPKGLLDL